MKYLDYDGLLYFWGKIKDKLNNKVDKVEGKDLSTNDYTTAEKEKLAGSLFGKAGSYDWGERDDYSIDDLVDDLKRHAA